MIRADDSAHRDRRAKIAEAIAEARRAPLSLDAVAAMAKGLPQDKNVYSLSDRQPNFITQTAVNVLIPDVFRAAISFEEQPCGLARHLSISVDAAGACPNAAAIQAIARAFGIACGENDYGGGTVWIEEFQPGHFAVNLVAVVDADQPQRTVQ